MRHILAALMPANKLALEVSLATGLRIGDVLQLRSDKLAQRMTVSQQKTSKTLRVYIPAGLLRQLQQIAGPKFVFTSRCDWRKPRTRQAVYKDLKRACKMYRLPYGSKLQISPHTARKAYAVTQYQTRGSLARVQQLLTHDSEAVTMLYAMADMVTARQHPRAVAAQSAAADGQ